MVFLSIALWHIVHFDWQSVGLAAFHGVRQFYEGVRQGGNSVVRGPQRVL